MLKRLPLSLYLSNSWFVCVWLLLVGECCNEVIIVAIVVACCNGLIVTLYIVELLNKRGLIVVVGSLLTLRVL